MIAQFRHPLSSHARASRWFILGLGGIPIVSALLYSSSPKAPLVPCLFRAIFGFPSPGCGLTRSFIALAQGNWWQAVSYHLFGPCLFFVCLGATMHVGIELVSGRSLTTPYERMFRQPWFMASGLLIFLTYYGLRLYAKYGTGDFFAMLEEFPVWQFLVASSRAV